MKTSVKKLVLASSLLFTTLFAVGSAYAAIFYFPHVATTDSWQTEIAIINTSPDQSVTGTLSALSNDGRNVEAKAITLSAHGRTQITVADEFTDHANIGYIVFDADSDTIQGYTKFYQEGVYRVAIPVVKEINTSDIYVSHIASNAEWWTGISLVNTTSAPKELTITFNTGQRVQRVLTANQHDAFRIRDLFAGQPQPDIQSAVITDASGIIGLELFGRLKGGMQLEGILLTDKTASTLYYPHVASDGWWTGIVAYNPSDLPSTITITPYSAQGTPLPPSTLSVAGKEKYVGTVTGLGLPAETAWFKIDSTKPLSGFSLVSTDDSQQLAAYAGNGETGAKAGVFAKIEKYGWTKIYLINTKNSTASVTLTTHTDTGAVVDTQVVSLAGHAKYVGEVQARDATYIAYSSDKNVVAFQLNGTFDWMLDGLPGLGGTALAIEKNINIFILNTGDIHESSKNLGKIFDRVTKVRKNHPGRVILLDAGDMLTQITQHTPKSRDWRGQHDRMFGWASSLNYDAMVFGNHDFVDSVKVTRGLIDKYRLPFVCANIKLDDPTLPKYKIIPIDVKRNSETITVKIGVIGLADQEKGDYHDDADKTDKKKLRDGVRKFFNDKKNRLSDDTIELIAEVEKLSDFVIFLTHNTDDIDEHLAKQLPGDKKHVIIGGHIHHREPLEKRVGGTSSYLVKIGAEGHYVGSTMVSWDPNSRKISDVTMEYIEASLP